MLPFLKQLRYKINVFFEVWFVLILKCANDCVLGYGVCYFFKIIFQYPFFEGPIHSISY